MPSDSRQAERSQGQIRKRKQIMGKSTTFAAACLGASLATAWAPSDAQAATDFKVTATGDSVINGFNALTVIYGNMKVDGSVVVVPDDATGSSVIRSGGAGWAGTLLLGKPDDYSNRSVEVFGIVTDTSTGQAIDHAVIGFSNPNSIVGHSFESVFGTSTSETDLIAMIRGSGGTRASATAASLQEFLAAAGVTPDQKNGSPISLVEFSDGALAGSVTVSVTPVPEPSGLAIMLAGAAGLLRRVRKLRW
jgi:hypothetical protein